MTHDRIGQKHRSLERNQCMALDLPQYRTQIASLQEAVTLETALAHLQEGAVIAVPTDTVYGLVCRYNDATAIERLYAIKKRPPQKALPVLLGDETQVAQVARLPLPPAASVLIRHFWPGPLTLVLAAREHLPAVLIAGGKTVAVRIPDHPFLRQVARRAGPLASSSANRSNQPAASTAQQVLDQLAGCVPLVVDGGETTHGLASTVVDLSGETPAILRQGPIAHEVQTCLGMA